MCLFLKIKHFLQVFLEEETHSCFLLLLANTVKRYMGENSRLNFHTSSFFFLFSFFFEKRCCACWLCFRSSMRKRGKNASKTVWPRNSWNFLFGFSCLILWSLMNLKFTLQTQSASNTLQKHKSSSSFTPFIDPRLLQISPSSGTTVTSVGK